MYGNCFTSRRSKTKIRHREIKESNISIAPFDFRQNLLKSEFRHKIRHTNVYFIHTPVLCFIPGKLQMLQRLRTFIFSIFWSQELCLLRVPAEQRNKKSYWIDFFLLLLLIFLLLYICSRLKWIACKRKSSSFVIPFDIASINFVKCKIFDIECDYASEFVMT